MLAIPAFKEKKTESSNGNDAFAPPQASLIRRFVKHGGGDWMDDVALDPTSGIQPPITFNTSNLADAEIPWREQPFNVQGNFIGPCDMSPWLVLGSALSRRRIADLAT